MDLLSAGTAAGGAITLAKQVREAMTQANAYSGNKSLIDVTRPARVEPLLLVDADVMNLEYTPDVVQTMQSLFSGYYLQAVDMVASLGKVSVLKKLEPLNPNRNVGLLDHNGDWRICAESYKHRLPTKKNQVAMALEAQKVDMVMGKDTVKTMMEATNLSVGKIYDVVLREGEQSAHIKIAIRVMANTMPTSLLVNMFSLKNKFDMDMKERYHAWRAGRLSFIKDLILCQDLIEKHRNALIKDKSGVYNEIINRQNKNIAAGIIDRNPSLATASNLAIISSTTAEQIEQKMMGRLSQFKTRQEIFETTNLMILAVIEKDYDRVVFYHRGIPQATDMSIRDIKVSNKNSGPEITDILKAFISGNAPAL